MAGCFSYLFIPAGVWCVAYGLWWVWKSRSSRAWPETSGRIISSTVEEELDSDGDRMYRVRIAYTYSVGGKEFTGTRAQFGDSVSTNLAEPATRLQQKYPPGSIVRVKHSAEHPEESTLESGIGMQAIILLAIGAGLLAFGIVFAIVS